MAREGAVASVVVAAHDEEDTIGACLETLVSGFEADELEVAVICNGCSDDTAGVARRAAPNAVVVELSEASKVAALREGDRRVTAFPRIYLDADVVLSATDVREVIDALVTSDAVAVSTRLRLDTSGASWAHRAYLRIWERLPSVAGGLAGRGVYALSERGRARFDEFPDVTNDDAFVDTLFSDDERTIVEGAVSTVVATGGLSGLVARKTRVVGGHTQLLSSGHVGQLRTSRSSWLGVVVREPRLAVGIPVYLYVSVAARIRSRRHGGDVAWSADRVAR
jgi:hypothetical protein